MHCHACRHEIAVAPSESVGFRDECERCQADAHVCLNCAHHDVSAYNECRESGAERILERDRQNRCEWFRPGRGEGDDRGQSEEDRAKRALEDLFK
jgi:hypothetical protein